MTNSWSLLAHHLEGTMDEVFPIKTKFKYNEDEILDSIKEYIGKTYSKHYSNKIQTLDLIDSVGDASAFCRSNILKYASRYDKKGTAKLDIQKIIHYAVLLYHFEGLDNDGYETI